eukprot:TRINITY_DN8922_c0_g1_i1.p1 TRINITY_DN8922_c0_g1~~TRINITY_DN8922_c0_g1_i1.p1  ORF type:complete len:277 (-),score=26.14 TRINITY_DN8922_c0_g1_i1:44-874(-)
MYRINPTLILAIVFVMVTTSVSQSLSCSCYHDEYSGEYKIKYKWSSVSYSQLLGVFKLEQSKDCSHLLVSSRVYASSGNSDLRFSDGNNYQTYSCVLFKNTSCGGSTIAENYFTCPAVSDGSSSNSDDSTLYIVLPAVVLLIALASLAVYRICLRRRLLQNNNNNNDYEYDDNNHRSNHYHNNNNSHLYSNVNQQDSVEMTSFVSPNSQVTMIPLQMATHVPMHMTTVPVMNGMGVVGGVGSGISMVPSSSMQTNMVYTMDSNNLVPVYMATNQQY